MKYSWYYMGNLYTPDECKELYEFAIANKSKQYADRPASGKNVNVDIVDTDIIYDKMRKFFNNVNLINQEYFGFELHGNPYSVNINTYSPGQEYPYHKDALDQTVSDVKLTAILNVSYEPYVGGDLEVFETRDVIIEPLRATGSLLVFPSFLYHRVLPVVSGTRKTLSAWFTGPHWR